MSLYAKALAALLGGIATWGVTASEGGIDAAEWFGLLGVIATAVAVFAVPNSTPDDEGAVSLSGVMTIALGIVVGVGLLYLLALLLA